MGKLKRAHVIETGIWLLIAAFLYAYTFTFNASIEIYKFGAAGWPRAVILLIVLAAMGNLFWHYQHGDHLEVEHKSKEQLAFEAAEIEDKAARDLRATDNEAPTAAVESKAHYLARIIPIIVLPFIYASLLERVGFYALTPVFIALIIFFMGERRVSWILGVTALIYGLLLYLFAKALFVGLPGGFMHPFYDFSLWLLPTIQDTKVLEFLGLAVVIPLALFGIVRAKGQTAGGISAGTALGKAALVYAAMFAFGTLSAYLLGGSKYAFVLFDVFKWPLGLLK